MAFYDDMQKVATGLLTEFRQGVIRHIALTPGNGPAHKPGSPQETPTILPGATARGVPIKYITGGLAQTGDLVVVSSVVKGLTVNQADKIEIDGVRYSVVEILPIPPAGTTVAFNFIVRR